MKREDVELVDLTAQEAKVQPQATVSVVESLLRLLTLYFGNFVAMRRPMVNVLHIAFHVTREH